MEPSVSAASLATARGPHNNFDGLRLIAAVLVVYGHQTIDLTGTSGMRLLVFFSISGFLISRSWQSDPHAGRFLLRRFLRIWPAYATVITVCAALSYVFPARDMPAISQMASLFYLSNLWFSGFDWGFFPARSPLMNGSLWMIRFEIDFYLAFLALALLRGRWLAIAAAGVVLMAWQAKPQFGWPGGLLECWSLYLGAFFAFGVVLHAWPRLRANAAVASFVLAGVWLLVAGQRTAGLLCVIAPSAIWVGERSWPVLRSAARFGDLSLGIFLWGWPVHQVTALWLPPITPRAVQLAVVLALVLPLAALSWHRIEAPALRRKPPKPQRLPRPDSTPAPAAGQLARWAPKRILRRL